MVKCNWIQIAHTSKEYLEPTNHMTIDRSHFLSTLNHNGNTYVTMENPKLKINTVNPFHVLTNNRFESETHFFEYSTESSKMDNVTISASNFTNIADWPDSIRSKVRRINRVNFDIKSKITTPSPFLNITDSTKLANDRDFEINRNESTYKGHSSRPPHNKQNAIARKTFVFKRLEYKPFDFMSVFDFLKNIQKSFLSRGFSAIEDKVTFLENFKETIMNNIGEINARLLYRIS